MIDRNTESFTWKSVAGRRLIVLVAAVLLLAPAAHASDWEGTWLVRAEQELSHCPDLGRTYGKVFTYRITVKNGQITAYEKDRGRTFTGVVNPKDPSRAHLRGVVAMEGGYTNEIIDVELVDANHLRGGTVWHWSDGIYQCGGSLTFTGVREGTPAGPAPATGPSATAPSAAEPQAPAPSPVSTPAAPPARRP